MFNMSWVDKQGYLLSHAPGQGAPKKGWSRNQHIAYREPVTQARHLRDRTAGETEQAWRHRAMGYSNTTMPDGSTLGTNSGPYGATYDPKTRETNLGWVSTNPKTGQLEPNKNYISAQRSGFADLVNRAPNQFAQVRPQAVTRPSVTR
jgi:hypothetical protein